MVTLYGPSLTLIPDGYINGVVTLFSGSFNTGDTITMSVTSVTAPGGYSHNGWGWVVNGVDISDATFGSGAFPQGAHSQVYTIPAAGFYVFQAGGGGGYHTALYLTANGMQLDASAINRCQYGTELQAGGAFLLYLTPGLIDVWLTADGLIWLAPLFTAFWFTTINVQVLCGSGPPPMPTIDLSTFEASAQTLLQILYVIAWPNLCRCTPGAPAPNPYPLPSPSEPPGWPAPVVAGCSNADICATLVSIQAQVAAIQRVVGADLGLTTLLQRYRLPFAYINGASHSLMNGSGSFAISRLIGMRVQITTPPAGGRTLAGTPPYVLDVGWMSILDPDGMIQEHRISETTQVWLPDHMAEATVFGYFLNAGVVVTFTELEAEP